MKALFLSLFVAAQMGTISLAQTRGQQIDPLAAGYEFCSQLTFSSERSECMNIINSAQFVDAEGLAVCKTMNFWSDKRQCLSSVVNFVFDPALTEVCRGLTFSSEKAECMGMIRGKFPRSAAALNICKQETFWSNKRSCLAGVLVQQAPIQVNPGQGYCTKRELRGLIDSASNNITRGRFAATLQDLANLASLIDYCFR
jgi:hypothetical protein